MKKIALFCAAAALVAAPALVSAPAQAKGCIKGAIVGGIAGHLVGHGKMGAVAGCAYGVHKAHENEDRSQQQGQVQNTNQSR